jgi:hypothetical protein
VFLQAYPTPESAQAASLEEIMATLRTGKHTNPRQAAARLVEELHQSHLIANAVTVRAKSRLMLSLTRQLLVVIEEIASYEKEIQALFLTQKDHEIWSSLPRAGKRLAPRLRGSNGAMIARGTPMPAVSRCWLARLPSPTKAAIMPGRTNALPV